MAMQGNFSGKVVTVAALLAQEVVSSSTLLHSGAFQAPTLKNYLGNILIKNLWMKVLKICVVEKKSTETKALTSLMVFVRMNGMNVLLNAFVVRFIIYLLFECHGDIL